MQIFPVTIKLILSDAWMAGLHQSEKWSYKPNIWILKFIKWPPYRIHKNKILTTINQLINHLKNPKFFLIDIFYTKKLLEGIGTVIYQTAAKSQKIKILNILHGCHLEFSEPLFLKTYSLMRIPCYT